MRLMTGRSTSRQPTTSDVGMGSVRQDFLADVWIKAHTSFSVRGWKALKDKHVGTTSTSGEVGTPSCTTLASMSERILMILRTKKPLMLLARAVLS